MSKIREILKLIRPEQWYKNLLVFLPLIFIEGLLVKSYLPRALLAFITLCLVSSTNYIINDMVDLKKDQQHLEKMHRPLAKGRVKKGEALIIAFIFLIVAIISSYLLAPYFLLIILGLFLLSLFYSLRLKKEAFLDILIIGLNFTLRAVSGALVLIPGKIIRISPWLVLCPFFLALFLAVGKRKANLQFTGNREFIPKGYTPKVIELLIGITTTLLIICYTLFSFLSDFPLLIISLPVAIYAILRYAYLIEKGSIIARKTELILTDWRLMITLCLWGALILIIIYFF